jgi:acetyltransferase
MTIRNLEHAFRPRSIAVIGASEEPGSVGKTLTDNVLAGDFVGPIYLVNPRRQFISGVRCFADVEALPEAPELAVIATPPKTVPAIVAALGRKGTLAAVVITAGLSEALRQEMLDAACAYCLRIIGPNCLGLWIPALGVNANFGFGKPQVGNLALLAQSGALIGGVLDWAASRNIGFSTVVSMGDMADVDVGDLLDFLAADISTAAILVYLETIPAARKFMSASRSAARAKPVVLIKAGRTKSAARAAATHTGALAGNDAAAQAAFRRAGVVRVFELDELFTAAETLTDLRPIPDNDLLILTNGGGAGVLAVDDLVQSGGRLASLSADLLQQLTKVLPTNWSRSNPIDIIGDANPERYTDAMEAVLASGNSNAILVMHCPTSLASSTDAAQAIIDAATRHRAAGHVATILTSWLGEAAVSEARRKFHEAGIPTYESPTDAIKGFGYLWQYTRAQDSLMQTPPRDTELSAMQPEAAISILRGAAKAGRSLLTEPEAKGIIAAFGITTVPTRVVTSLEQVGAAASVLLKHATSVVVKILSDQISHKSDVGGVRLGLRSPQDAQRAAEEMRARLAELRPDARLQGFTIQPMIVRPKGQELLLGVFEDQLFGPTILFGAGGTATEIIQDAAAALPPLDFKLARDLMEQTRIFALLKGYRDRPPVQLDAIAEVLVRLSQLVIACPAIRELDINPLLADESGVIALDARIRIEPSEADQSGPNPRLAIRPYPNQWEKSVKTVGGRDVIIRPIKPIDEQLYQAFIDRLSPEDIRFRFLAPQKEFSHRFIARFTQIDYARAMAFVALSKDEQELLGVVRLAADPDYRSAEFAIIVRSDLKGQGIGWELMQQLIYYADAEGLADLHGNILAANTRMLQMCRDLGFEINADPEDQLLFRVTLKFPSAAEACRTLGSHRG